MEELSEMTVFYLFRGDLFDYYTFFCHPGGLSSICLLVSRIKDLMFFESFLRLEIISAISEAETICA